MTMFQRLLYRCF